MEFEWLIPLMSLIAAGFGAYYGSYLKKKGKNLATKEDFQDIKKQTEQLTKTTEIIKHDLGKQYYLGQQRWSAKRDQYMQLMNILNEIWSDNRILNGIKKRNRSRCVLRRG